jgi:hypothetical protein
MTIGKPSMSIAQYYDSFPNIIRNSDEHKMLGLMASDEAEQVLSYFEKACPGDDRPRLAIEKLRQWASGKIDLSMAETRKLSLDAHAAARSAKTDAAKFAARAAGQAVATWHVPKHAIGAEWYVAKIKQVS